MNSSKVVVYHAPGWAGCRAAMEFLRAKGVPFEEKDVVADPEYMEELLQRAGGVRGTPVIIVGDDVVRGFDRGRLSRLLGLG